MACFLVPVAEAIVTTIVEKALKSTEKKAAVKLNSADGTALEVSKNPVFCQAWLAQQAALGRLRSLSFRARLAWRNRSVFSFSDSC